jgi:hypothetical protein
VYGVRDSYKVLCARINCEVFGTAEPLEGLEDLIFIDSVSRLSLPLTRCVQRSDATRGAGAIGLSPCHVDLFKEAVKLIELDWAIHREGKERLECSLSPAEQDLDDDLLDSSLEGLSISSQVDASVATVASSSTCDQSLLSPEPVFGAFAGEDGHAMNGGTPGPGLSVVNGATVAPSDKPLTQEERSELEKELRWIKESLRARIEVREVTRWKCPRWIILVMGHHGLQRIVSVSEEV